MKEREYTADERLAGLFQPDTLLPSQFFDRVRRRSEQAGARDPRGQALFREAEEWIGDPDRTWLFSFENICDVLGLDADYLRRGLRAWKERALEGRRGKVVSLRADERDELRKASGD